MLQKQGNRAGARDKRLRPYAVERHAQRGADHQQIAAPGPDRRGVQSRQKSDGDPEHRDQDADGLARRQGFASDRRANDHGQQGEGRQGECAPRCRREDQRRVEQDRKQGKIQNAQSGHTGPVPPRRPTIALQKRNRQQQQKADAEPERADRKGINRVHQITCGANRRSAEATR